MARKRKNRRDAGPIIALGFLLAFLAFIGWFAGTYFLNPYALGIQHPSVTQETSFLVNHGTSSTLKLYSSNATLIRLEDQKCLLEKNGQEKIYPASLTKIMTAAVAIEQIPNLREKVELSADLFQPLYDANASLAGFLPGEWVRAEDLLYGALLPSGAECCVGLANAAAGSEEAFVNKMNQMAQKLGMVNTHFTNCTGLHEPDQYSTTEDIARLLNHVLQNKTFREIFTSHHHSVKGTNLHPDGVTFYSSFFQSAEGNTSFFWGEILGGKTGYTNEAGLCLATLAQVNGKEYILVTAGAQGDHNTQPFHVMDAVSVYESLSNSGNSQ